MLPGVFNTTDIPFGLNVGFGHFLTLFFQLVSQSPDTVFFAGVDDTDIALRFGSVLAPLNTSSASITNVTFLAAQLIVVTDINFILDGVKFTACPCRLLEVSGTGNFTMYRSELVGATFTSGAGLVASGVSLFVYDSLFKSCKAQGSSQSGGCFWGSGLGDVLFSNTEFNGCWAQAYGASLYFGGYQTFRILDSKILNGWAYDIAGGGIFFSSGQTPLHIERTSISGHKCYSGCGIRSTGGSVTLIDSKVNSNQGLSWGGTGAGIYMNGGALKMINCDLIGNNGRGYADSRSGGGIAGVAMSSVFLHKLNAHSNSINYSPVARGGAIHLWNTPLTITSSSFTSNSGTQWGGAISYEGVGPLVMEDVFFGSNSAVYGGALRIPSIGAVVNMTNVRFQYNRASEQAGAISANEDNKILLLNTTMCNNMAPVNESTDQNLACADVCVVDQAEECCAHQEDIYVPAWNNAYCDCSLGFYRNSSNGVCEGVCEETFGTPGAPCATCLESGCDADGCAFNISATGLCIIDCPVDEYQSEHAVCRSCTDYGPTCTRCDLNQGCFNEGCDEFISAFIPADCIPACPGGIHANGLCTLRTTWHIHPVIGNDTFSCGAMESPCLHILYAMDLALIGDTIMLMEADYDLTGNLVLPFGVAIVGQTEKTSLFGGHLYLGQSHSITKPGNLTVSNLLLNGTNIYHYPSNVPTMGRLTVDHVTCLYASIIAYRGELVASHFDITGGYMSSTQMNGDVLIEDGIIKQSPGNGIGLQGAWQNPNTMIVRRVRVIDSVGRGFYVTVAQGVTRIEDSFFTKNKGRGAGIHFFDHINDVYLHNITVIDNESFDHYSGGVYLYRVARLFITSAVIRDNTQADDLNNGEGGGLCCWTAGQVYISDSIIENNWVAQNGGGIRIALTSPTSILHVNNTVFSTNVAKRNLGGGLFVESSQPSIPVVLHDVLFISNSGSLSGGLGVTGVVVTMTNCSFCMNRAFNNDLQRNTAPESLSTECSTCSFDQPSCCGLNEAVHRPSPFNVYCDCAAGYLRTLGGLCLANCPLAEYDFGDGTCHGCEDAFGVDCTECNKTIGCFPTGCAGKLHNGPLWECEPQCTNTEYHSGTKYCVDCPLNGPCLTCDSVTADCLKCHAGAETEGDGCVDCPTGEWTVGNVTRCHQCNILPASTGQGNCTACIKETGVCTASSCIEGDFASVDGQCDPCSTHTGDGQGNCTVCTSTDPRDVCTAVKCDVGSYATGLGTPTQPTKCNSCSHFAENQASRPCTACTDASGCSECDGGYLSLATTPICLATGCPANQFTADGSNQCQSCNDVFGEGGGGQFCSACGADEGCTYEGCALVLTKAVPHICTTTCESGEKVNSNTRICESTESDDTTDPMTDLIGGVQAGDPESVATVLVPAVVLLLLVVIIVAVITLQRRKLAQTRAKRVRSASTRHPSGFTDNSSSASILATTMSVQQATSVDQGTLGETLSEALEMETVSAVTDSSMSSI